jgi:hypothetical protein
MSSGIAVALTASPIADTDWLTRSVRKSRFRRRDWSLGRASSRTAALGITRRSLTTPADDDQVAVRRLFDAFRVEGGIDRDSQ